MERCDWCGIEIDPSCDEAHLLSNDEEETVCDADFNDYLVYGRPNPYLEVRV